MNLAMDLIREALLGGSGGGGGGGMTRLLHDELEVSTTSTTSTLVKEYDLTELVDFRKPDVGFLIHIRDKAGIRNGYFIGSDRYAINTNVLMDKAGYSQQNAFFGMRVTSGGEVYSSSSFNFGVAGEFTWSNSSRLMRVYSKYGNSATIDGTYTVDLYEVPAIDGKLY